MKKIFTSILIVLFIVLLAACGKKTFTVTFNSDGGNTVAPVEVKDGEKVAAPSAAMTKEGYIFVEWRLNGVAYDFDAPVKGNITLVAHWDEVPVGFFVISFDSDGGTAVAPITVGVGQFATAPTAPRRDYFSFQGWFLGEATTAFAFATTPITGNLILKAKWEAAPYNQANTYRTYLGNVHNINPHFNTLADASTLYSLISDTLYYGDFDWDEMIAQGVVTEANRGDLTKVTFGTVYADASELPYNYFPSMATARPEEVAGSNGTKWRITLKSGLKFTDGTVINADTFSESYKLLLDPKLLNPRATNLYSSDSIPLKNAENYFKQGSAGFPPTVAWSEVGFDKISDLTFELELGVKKSQWHMMTWLASAITSVVHVENYKSGLIENDTRTTYGTIANPHVSFGAYKLIEWVEEGYYVFQRNTENHRVADFRMPFVRYDVISDQSVAIQEFRNGRLDLANASGTYYADYEGNVNLKISPVTTFFRFAFGLTREGGNPIVKDADFRKAMYLAVDRTTFSADVRKPSEPTHGILGSQYFSSEGNGTNYRNSAAGIAVLADYSPETNGYDPEEALRLFNLAYARLVADTTYDFDDGDKITVEFAMADAQTNHIMADWMAAQFASIFGATRFEFKKNPVTSVALTGEGGIWDTGNFDVTFGGWQGLQFWAPGMLQVYSSGRGSGNILEVGFETGNAILNIDLELGKAAVEDWLEELEAIPLANRTQVEKDYIELFEGFLDRFGAGALAKWIVELNADKAATEAAKPALLAAVDADTTLNAEEKTAKKAAIEAAHLVEIGRIDTIIDGINAEITANGDTNPENVWFGIYDELWDDVYYTILDYSFYDNKDIEMDRITGTLEAELLRQMINIPLFTNVGVTIYSARVGFEVNAFHARMGWGGLKYMYFK